MELSLQGEPGVAGESQGECSLPFPGIMEEALGDFRGEKGTMGSLKDWREQLALRIP